MGADICRPTTQGSSFLLFLVYSSEILLIVRCVQYNMSRYSHLEPLLQLDEKAIPVAGTERSMSGVFFVQVQSRIRHEMFQEASSHGLHAPVPILGPLLDVRRCSELLDNLSWELI